MLGRLHQSLGTLRSQLLELLPRAQGVGPWVGVGAGYRCRARGLVAGAPGQLWRKSVPGASLIVVHGTCMEARDYSDGSGTNAFIALTQLHSVRKLSRVVRTVMPICGRSLRRGPSVCFASSTTGSNRQRNLSDNHAHHYCNEFEQYMIALYKTCLLSTLSKGQATTPSGRQKRQAKLLVLPKM